VKPEHLQSLHHIHVGAAPVGEALINQFREKAPNVLLREGEFRHLEFMFSQSKYTIV
jgi:hypothetical protein